ncbi:MAG: hypothetical protein EAS51_08855 [Microbacteriaceae bacterium]|nr:MAG: hypothetical protein EAS51_08855 [Microbacteriaceae bacterium]
MSDASASAASAASATPSATKGAAPLPRPRIRTGAVLWGLVLVAIASFVLWAAATPERRESVVEAVLTLTPLGWTVVVVIAVGATITLLALAAVIRRLQRRPDSR